MKLGGASAAALIFGFGPFTEKIWAEPRFSDYQFKLGVASGDPLPDGVLLWTRLAPDPLNGGMPQKRVPVQWQVATDEDFANVVREGATFTNPELAHSVHVEVDGLNPASEYFYRFRDGYVGSRNRITNSILENDVQNPVVLTGDVHNNWACELKANYDDQSSQTLGVEFVGTSVTSGGNGADTSPSQEAVVAENPHIEFFNGQRGYVRYSLTPEEWRADYRVLPFVRGRGREPRSAARGRAGTAWHPRLLDCYRVRRRGRGSQGR